LKLRLEVLEVVTVAPLKVYPRNPPIRPRINPTKFSEITEKTSTSIDPIFLLAALLYSSHDPTSVNSPAMLPHTRIIVASIPGISKELTVLAMKALIRVISPASADSAKAAVGFGDVFTAKVHPYK
jgi:hypothetical protein